MFLASDSGSLVLRSHDYSFTNLASKVNFILAYKRHTFRNEASESRIETEREQKKEHVAIIVFPEFRPK